MTAPQAPPEGAAPLASNGRTEHNLANASGPITEILAALEEAGCQPKRCGRQWQARCPAHHDRRPSLSVGVGEGGRVVLNCFAGCHTVEVLSKLGLQWGDLLPEGAQPSRRGAGSNPAPVAPLRAPLRGTSEHKSPIEGGRSTADGEDEGPDFGAYAKRCTDAMTPKQRQTLADKLGVHPDALERLGVGIDGEQSTWPEAAPDGRVTNVMRRAPDGSKRAMRGSQRGLTLPDGAKLRPVPDGEPLLVAEGATDCAALLSMGLGAVACPSAGVGERQLVAVLASFEGRVIVLGDNDASGAGQKHAERVSAALAAGRVSAIVTWAMTPGGAKDAREWLKARIPDSAASALDQALVDAGVAFVAALHPQAPTPERTGPTKFQSRAILTRLSDVKPEPVVWLWPARIPSRMLSLIVGDPGTGKSTLTLDLAARITTGAPFPDRPEARRDPGGVVILNAEDDLATVVRPRFDAADGDPERANFLDAVKQDGARRCFTLADIPALEDAITRTPDCRLVLIDPLSAYLGKVDPHKDAEVRGLLMPLADLAKRMDVAVLVVMHLNKATTQPALYRPGGSIGFAAAARAVWAVASHPSDKAIQVLTPVKSNLAASASGLAFKVDNVQADTGPIGRVSWIRGEVTIAADELLGSRRSSGGESAGERAGQFLRDELADGPVLEKDLQARAKRRGLSWGTIKRVKKEAGVKSKKASGSLAGQWWWSLQEAEGAQKADEDAQLSELIPFEDPESLRDAEPDPESQSENPT